MSCVGCQYSSHVNHPVETAAVQFTICVTLSIRDINIFLYKQNKEATVYECYSLLGSVGVAGANIILDICCYRFLKCSTGIVYVVSWVRPAPHPDLSMF